MVYKDTIKTDETYAELDARFDVSNKEKLRIFGVCRMTRWRWLNGEGVPWSGQMALMRMIVDLKEYYPYAFDKITKSYTHKY